jgi:prolipoprotein diacylglyceryl transferase
VTNVLIPGFIPSPSSGVWYLGPLPLRGYALCIIAGIIAAIWIGERRWVGRGGLRGEVTDLALWAVPFGVIGGRIYHVITDHDLYFGDDRSPIQALYVWRGGLGIWGAIALGGVGVWLGAKSKGIRVPPVLDAMAPGVLVAQALGRWGNWFNQELYGKPTDLPWGLKIDYDPSDTVRSQYPPDQLFQPTFLYECLWDLGAFGFVIWADRRFKLGHGRVLALYVMAYTAGRGWIEMLRIDDVEYQHVLGLRLNVWTSIVLFCLAAAYFVVVGRKRPGRETEVYTEKRLAADRAAAEAAEGGETSDGAKGEKGKKGATIEGAAAGAATATLVDEKTATKAAEDQSVAKPSAKKSTASGTAKQAADLKAAGEKPGDPEAPTDSATGETTASPKAPTTKAPAAEATPAKKAAPAKKATAKKAAPAKKATAKKAPAKKAPAKKPPATKTTPAPTSADGAAATEATDTEATATEATPTEATPTEKPRNDRTDTPE